MFFIVLLRCFIYMRVIHTDKADSISRMVVYMLKNWSKKYSSYYIIKFISFIPIYYDINLDIVLSFMVLVICIFDLLIYLS